MHALSLLMIPLILISSELFPDVGQHIPYVVLPIEADAPKPRFWVHQLQPIIINKDAGTTSCLLIGRHCRF